MERDQFFKLLKEYPKIRDENYINEKYYRIRVEIFSHLGNISK